MVKETIQKIYSGDQALFSQWDSLAKIAGYQKSVANREQKPTVVHMFHLVDPLGRLNEDGHNQPHVVNEYFSYKEGKEIQPAWFAVSDMMPFLTLETESPHEIGKFLGMKFENFAKEVASLPSRLNPEEFSQLQQTISNRWGIDRYPQNQDEVYRQFTSSNWYGVVDSADKAASYYQFSDIKQSQRRLIAKLQRSALNMLPREDEGKVKERVSSLAGEDSRIYQEVKDKSLPEVASVSFSILSHELERLTDLPVSDVVTTESTKYFRLTGADAQENGIDDNDTRFKFLDWYLKNNRLYTEAHNKVSNKLSNDGQNPIQAISTTRGETPFWIVINGKKSKMFLKNNILQIGDKELEVEGNVKTHADLADILSKHYPDNEVSVVPTAIGLLLQMRSNGVVLLPEKGSSYTHQVDLVWKHIVENGTPQIVKGLAQKEIARVHPHALDALPENRRIQLPWYLSRGFSRDEEGFTTTTEIKYGWKGAVENNRQVLEEAAACQTLTEKAKVLYKEDPVPFMDTAINFINIRAEAEGELKEIRSTLMKNVRATLDKKDLPRLKEVAAFVNGETLQLPEGIELSQGVLEQVQLVRQKNKEFQRTDGEQEKHKTLLLLFDALRFRELIGGIKALEYYDARPSLLSSYVMFGEEAVKNIIDKTEVYYEKPEVSDGQTHIYNAGGNSFILYEDNLGQFDVNGSEELKKKLRIDLEEKGLDSALVLTTPESNDADCRMHILEKDGSISAMCGNGSRAIGHLYYQKDLQRTEPVKIETVSGEIVEVSRVDKDFVARLSEVTPLNPATAGKEFKDLSSNAFQIKSAQELLSPMLPAGVKFIEVSQILGEPHMIIDAEEGLAEEDLRKVSHFITNAYDDAGSLLFPQGINVNFLKSNGPDGLLVKTYERGVNDFTRSCGTGAVCSADVILREHPELTVVVTNPGTELSISKKDGHYYLRGPVERIN